MLQFQLPEEFNLELKKIIQEAYTNAIEQSRKDVGINVEYLTKQQAMDLYSISNNTLMDWVSNGLEMYRINGKIYVSRSKTDEFIEQHQI